MKPNWIFPKGRRFHKSHCWAMKMDALRLRVGLDAFGADLVGPSMSVVLPLPGSLLRENEPGCWLVDDGGTTPIRMPISGRVVGVNHTLLAQPGLIGADPYEKGWLLEMVVENPDQSLARLWDADRMNELAATQWHTITNKVQTRLRKESNRVGPTMADGGQQIGNLRDLLGPSAYRRLMTEFL